MINESNRLTLVKRRNNAKSKAKLTNETVKLTVWWSIRGVIHHSFLRSGQTIKACVYCAEVQTMMAKLRVKQHGLVNCSSP